MKIIFRKCIEYGIWQRPFKFKLVAIIFKIWVANMDRTQRKRREDGGRGTGRRSGGGRGERKGRKWGEKGMTKSNAGMYTLVSQS